MIKRRFYRFEHGNRDDPSGSSDSSSSSDSEVEVEPAVNTDIEDEEKDNEEEDDEVKEGEDEDNEEDVEVKERKIVASDIREKGEASSSSGYESEDSSVNEVNLDSSGLPSSDDDVDFPGVEGKSLPTSIRHSPKVEETGFRREDFVLKHHSVFKCRICPRIVCLSEETLKAHLSSKKHARSEKLLKEGRLKLMLNEKGKVEGEEYYDNGRIEDDSHSDNDSRSYFDDSHSENDDTTPVPEQKSAKPNRKKGKGRSKRKKRENDTEPRPAKKSSYQRRQERRQSRKNGD